MRPTWILACAFTFFALASNSRAGLPITMIAGDPSPATTPAAPVPVLLLPFHLVGQSGDYVWISDAIDEDLSHDLSRNHAIRIIRPATTQPLSAADELATARDVKADRLVSGSYQVVDDQLRITANVTDVNQAQSVGEIKATGTVRDLFQLEDSLAMQLWHDLPQASQQATASNFQVTPLEDYVASQQATQPQVYGSQVDVAPAPAYDTAPDYGAVYPYGYFGYGYPYGFGGPLFFGGIGRGFGHQGHFGGFGGGGGFHPTPHTGAPRAGMPSGFRAGGGVAFGAHR